MGRSTGGRMMRMTLTGAMWFDYMRGDHSANRTMDQSLAVGRRSDDCDL